MVMKKSFWGLLLALLLILTACGGKEAANTANGDAANGTAKTRDSIKIAIEGAYPPYNFINAQNQLEGFDVDFSLELAKRLGVKAELVATPWDSMIPGLIAGKYDIIVSDMAITEERKKKVDFSDHYFTTGNQLFVPNGSPIKDPAEIKGQKIGVTISTTASEIATQMGADVVLYKNDFLAFADLENNRLAGVITDQGVGAQIIKEKNYAAGVIGGLLNEEEAGITIRKEDSALKEQINKVIAEMQKDGSYEQISKKWFGKDIR